MSLLKVMLRLTPRPMAHLQEFLASLGVFPSPHHTLEASGGVHVAGEGADFAVDRITGDPLS